MLVEMLGSAKVGAYEIINNNAGSLTVSIQHPFGRGVVQIISDNPFDPPSIDPRWGSNPIDLQILIEALRFNRQILATAPMVELQPAQFVPTVDADDASLLATIKNGIRTEFHPSGTCAMLPLEHGGVVDSHLRVWNTQNLRVVDAGMMPLVPAAHLQATVYAVAEKVWFQLNFVIDGN
jgi:choline dehydrogenase